MAKEDDRNTQAEAKKLSRRKFLTASAASGAAVAASSTVVACVTGEPTGKRSAAAAIETPEGPIRWAMVLDLGKCTGCKSCSVACKVQNDVPLGVFRRAVKELEVGTYPSTERRYLPWLCNQCDSPPCIDRCPVDAVCVTQGFPGGEELAYLKRATYKRPDGVVLVDDERCIGCGYCVEDCPYGARFINANKAAASSDHADAGDYVADKCDYCVRRVEGGVVPACVSTCPANAMVFGNMADPDSEVSKLIAAGGTVVLAEPYATDPITQYAGHSAADTDDIFIDGSDVKDERCSVESDDSCRASG